MSIFYYSLGLFLLTSCFSSGKDDLDIPLKATDQVEVSVKGTKNGGADSAITVTKVPVSSVIKWQNFFKPPPSIDQRKAIEKRLLTWSYGDSIEDLIKKGRNEVAIGRLKKAEVNFREAIRKDPKNLDSLLELAMLYLRKNDLKRAFNLLSNLREGLSSLEKANSTLVFRYKYVLALSYIARGDGQDGHRVLSDLIGIDKSFTPGYVALASSYASQGKLKVAEFIAKRGIDRGKESAALYNVLGVVAEKNGNLEDAEQWYNKAYNLSPAFAPALVNRANLHIKRFNYDDAEEDLIRALMYQPNNVPGLISLGIVKKRVGKFEGAKAAFTKALDINAENAIARFNLAVLMADAFDRPNEAVRLFFEVIQTSSSNLELKQTAKNYINDIKENRESY